MQTPNPKSHTQEWWMKDNARADPYPIPVISFLYHQVYPESTIPFLGSL